MKKHPCLHLLRACAVSAFALLASNTQAQNLVYFEDFDVDETANWAVNQVGNSNVADIFFDYSSVGIPPAPNATGASTRGLKLQANLPPGPGVFPSGVSVSPIDFGITENFEMHWDMWINVNGPFPVGGSGSTQVSGGGYGTAGNFANVAGSADCIFIGATGDGNAGTSDYRVYSPGKSVSYQAGQYVLEGGFFGVNSTDFRAGDPASGFVYAGNAGSRDSDVSYYVTNFPGQSAPAAQLALYPQQTGTLKNGTIGMKWHDVSITKIANTITYRIDGILIATVDAVDATIDPFAGVRPLGGANIMFNHYDINAGNSADPNAPALAFTLIDNVRITNFPNVVGVEATVVAASEAGPVTGTFTITRTSAGAPLTVNYTLSGTASNGVDYVSLPGSVTFGATDTTTNLTVTPIDDAISEETERVILSINPSSEYTGAGSAAITIADNEPSQLVITNLFEQTYETPNDYVTFKVTRLGDLTTTIVADLSFGGTATQGVDYSPETTFVVLDPGVISATNKISGLRDDLVEGDETIVVSIQPGGSGEYTVGTPGSATATIIDANLGPETVLFSDDFSTDTSANYDLLFGSTNTDAQDYYVQFGFDYTGLGFLPPAPNSTNFDTLGVWMTVNKDLTPSAAAINLYPKGQSFSGDFALRFDMYLVNGGGASATEYALFGMNHSGTKTNWFRNTAGGVGAGATFDGLFVGVESDGAGLGDYALYSAPTTAGNNPTPLASRSASTLTGIFKSPPFVVAGAAANSHTNPTPTWTEVELSQVGGTVTLRINRTVIFTHENTTAFESGNIMIGYEDAYDSIGQGTAAVVFDNLRVVRLTSFRITSVESIGNNIQIDFTYEPGKSGSLKVKSAGEVDDTFADTAATITETSPGVYRATLPKNGTMRFYRIAL